MYLVILFDIMMCDVTLIMGIGVVVSVGVFLVIGVLTLNMVESWDINEMTYDMGILCNMFEMTCMCNI